MSTRNWSAPSHNRLSRSSVPSAAWQHHVHDRHIALKKARYLSLKVTPEILCFFRVEIPGGFLAPERGSANHLVGLKQERRGNGQAQGFRGLEVDDQLELHGPLNGQVGRRRASARPASRASPGVRGLLGCHESPRVYTFLLL